MLTTIITNDILKFVVKGIFETEDKNLKNLKKFENVVDILE